MKLAVVHISILFISLFALQPAQAQKALEVLVQDQRIKAVPGIRVAVQNSDYYTTNEQGKFQLPLTAPLRLPVRAELEDERWEVLRTEHFENVSRLVIYVRRLILPDELVAVQVSDTLGQPLVALPLTIEGTDYQSDSRGAITLPSPVSVHASFRLPDGYRIKDRSTNTTTHILSLRLYQQAKVEQPAVAATAGGDPLVKAYEEDFERIAQQIEQDRALYEEKNEEIRKEITKIQEKLTSEDISGEQRSELTGYLSGLERTLEENSEAIRRSEARTKDALLKLKNLLVEKDSISRVALGRIQQVEAEKALAEEAFRKKMMVFTAITLGLLVVLGIVYFFAFKFRKQKLWLKEANKRLKAVQDELTQSLRELNLKKAQIEDHNQQLEVFVYKASHDIKGPLRSIMGLTQIGLNDVKDNVALEYFQHIYKSTRRLDNLLMDLLKLTKVKQAEVERQEIDLQSMLQDIIQSFSNIRHFDLVKIDVDLAENIQLVSDEKLLYSVLQNFTENAIKYCDPYKSEPYLKVTVTQEEGKTIFTFKDNGLGIQEEYLPKIFDMFFKIDPSSDGTGLGLHIVKLTIEKLGGKLQVRSRVREGSTFILTLPDQCHA